MLKRDYTGAKTLLEFTKPKDSPVDWIRELWGAFCAFHLGDYRKALEQYEVIRKGSKGAIPANEVDINIAVCMFYLGMYEESLKLVESIPNTPLKIRILFHLANKVGDEDRLMELHGSLRDVTEDQLSLAGMHYLRAHYQEAIDIYKRILLDNK